MPLCSAKPLGFLGWLMPGFIFHSFDSHAKTSCANVSLASSAIFPLRLLLDFNDIPTATSLSLPIALAYLAMARSKHEWIGVYSFQHALNIAGNRELRYIRVFVMLTSVWTIQHFWELHPFAVSGDYGVVTTSLYNYSFSLRNFECAHRTQSISAT